MRHKTETPPDFLDPTPFDPSRAYAAVSSRQFPGLWLYLEPMVRGLVRCFVYRMSLARSFRLASDDRWGRRPLAASWGVRNSLRENETDDVVQDVAEALLRAVQRGALLTSADQVRGYASQTTLYTTLRKTKLPAALLFACGRDDTGSLRHRVESASGAHGDPSEERGEHAYTPDEEADVEAALAALRAAVEELPTTWRLAVRERLDGRSFDESSRALGVPAATLRTWNHRAEACLRERLGAPPLVRSNVGARTTKRAARNNGPEGRFLHLSCRNRCRHHAARHAEWRVSGLVRSGIGGAFRAAWRTRGKALG